MKKSMKKIICMIMATVMIMAMGVTAFAAESPNANGVVTSKAGQDAKGTAFSFSMKAYAEDFNTAVASVQSANGLKAVMGSAYIDGMEVIDVRSVSLDNANVTYPIKLTFNVPGVTAGTKVAVLAYVNDKWVMLECVAGNGTITVTFENAEQLQAVAFVVDKNTVTGSLQTSGAATGNKVSPKTGESTEIPAMFAVAILLLIGGAYCLRKKEVR